MSLDIIIFAVVAAVLIARLRSVLGTRHGDERRRGNPFEQVRAEAKNLEIEPKENLLSPDYPPQNPDSIVIDDSFIKAPKKDVEGIKKTLQKLTSVDSTFDVQGFLTGARGAFEMITGAFAKGDSETLKPLLSEDLYSGFVSAISDREEKGYVSEYELHRIKEARVAAARLGGVMAYVTVDFDIEQTTTLKDKDGKVIEGDPDKITEVHDVWTFARDTRSRDPNWELVATQLGDG